MAKRGKKYTQTAKKLKTNERLSLQDAIERAKKASYSNFDGSLELHLNIKLPKDKNPRSIKGSYSLPHSVSKKSVKIAVFTDPKNEEIAQKAGADITNLDQLIKDVKEGKIEFDVAIATPDVMPKISVLGRQLGPKGLMPNPKLGTVTTTEKLADTIAEYKKGKQTFKCDEQGNVHVFIGKLSQPTEELKENIKAVIDVVSSTIGKAADQLIKSAYLAPTMGISIPTDVLSE